MTRWDAVKPSADEYADRFARLERRGGAVHGEADLVERLAAPGARILDAGCGTGRVAIRLQQRGFHLDGVDVDPAMLAIAAKQEPGITWVAADLAVLGDAVPGPYDIVLAAGNVMPLLAAGTEQETIAALASRTTGVLIAGFGLDAAHLPLDEAPFGLAEYDTWCAAAGLTLEQRFATWAGDAYDDGPYAVSVHRAAATA